MPPLMIYFGEASSRRATRNSSGIITKSVRTKGSATNGSKASVRRDGEVVCSEVGFSTERRDDRVCGHGGRSTQLRT